MSDPPLVSIVTPSFNQSQFLEATILSVLSQDYPKIEYIIIDGGSTDGSLDLIRKYEEQISFWVSKPDKGQADAINKGWQRATGDFLGWINSDDLLTPDSVSSVIRYFHEHPEVGFVFGDLESIDIRGRHLGFQTYREFDLVDIVKKTGWISQQGSLVRRSVFEEVGPLDTSLHFHMDLDYWLRAGLVCKFGYLRKVVACFRLHRDAKSLSKTYLSAKDVITLYNKFFNRNDLPVEFSLVRQQAWGNAHLYAARAWCTAYRLREAYSELVKACRVYPDIVFSFPFYRSLLYLLFVGVFGVRPGIIRPIRRIVNKLMGAY